MAQTPPQITLADVQRVIQDAVSSNLSLAKSGVTKYEGVIGWEATRWLEELEDELSAKGWTEQQKKERFKNFLTAEARDWYKINIENGPPVHDWAALRQKFLDYHSPKDKRSYTRKRMMEFVQRPGQDVLKYITGKELRCIEHDANMDAGDKLHYIIEGLLPEIKAGVLQQAINTVADLKDSAEKIERGLKYMGRDIGSEQKRDQKLDQIEAKCEALVENITSLVETVSIKDKQLEKLRQNHERDREMRRELEQAIRSRNDRFTNSGRETYYRAQSRDRPQGFDRERSRERIQPASRDTSRERERGYYRDRSRDRAPDNTRNRPRDEGRYRPPGYENRGVLEERDRSHSRERGLESNQPRAISPSQPRVNFELPRKIAESRTPQGDANCWNCGLSGHHARGCLKPPRNKSPAPQRRANLTNLRNKIYVSDNLIYQTVEINGREVSALIDCGSEVSLIEARLARSLGLKSKSTAGDRVIKAVNGSNVRLQGEVQAAVGFLHNNMRYTIQLRMGMIPNFDFSLLLGNDFNKAAGIIIDCKTNTITFDPDTENKRIRTYGRPIHATLSIELKPRASYLLSASVAYRRKGETFTAFVRNSPEIYEKRRFFLKEAEVEFSDGRAVIKITNCSNDPLNVKQGSIIGHLNEINGQPGRDCLPIESTDYASMRKFSRHITHRSEAEVKSGNVGDEPEAIARGPICNFCYVTEHKENKCELKEDWYHSHAVRTLYSTDRSALKSTENIIEPIGKNYDTNKYLFDQSYVSEKSESLSGSLDLLLGSVIVDKALTDKQRTQLRELLLKFEGVMAFDKSQLGICSDIEHIIDTTETRPIQQKYRWLPAHKRAAVNEQVAEWLRLGVIRECRSQWSSPVVIVQKKSLDENGRPEMRLCIDMRKLNEVTKKDAYPLPNVRDCLDAFGKSKFFTSLDLNSGYLQVRVREQDQEKTAFVTQDGLYCFQFMPFGLKSAPMTFQRAMDYHLSGLKWNTVIVYLDDCVVFSDTFESHLAKLEAVLTRIKESGMTISPKKCSFAMRSVKFLGHIVSETGIATDPDTVEAVERFPPPQTVRDVRAFLGLAGFYRLYVENFSLVAQPLSNLTRPSVGFMWGKDQQSAFDYLKKRLMSAPILIHFCNSLPTELRCDGSKIGIGSQLLQRIDGKPHAVRYDSRLLKDAEKNYFITEIECLAVIHATNKCEKFLLGIFFTIISDHASLQWVGTKDGLPHRLHRWALHLMKFDYQVIYKSGQVMRDVDCLSRKPVGPPRNEPCNLEKHCLKTGLVKDGQELTDEEIAEIQKQDRFFGQIYAQISEGLENARLQAKYTLVNGVLMRTPRSKEGVNLLICVPYKLELYILFAYHDCMFSGGHLGSKKAKAKIMDRFYWPNMSRDIEWYVRTCSDCQSRKHPLLPKAGLMVPIVYDEPFQCVSIDFLGPMTASSKGNRYIITATDMFTKWAEARAIRSENKRTAADFFIEQIVTKHGTPKRILSDRGSQFRAQFSEYLFKRLGTQQVMTTSYHPQCNGLVEKFNQTLSNMLSMYVSANQRDWCGAVHAVTFAYNTSVNATTGYTPFFLVHGREATLPADRSLRVPQLQYPTDEDYLHNLNHNLKEARRVAKINTQKAANRNKQYYDRRHREVRFAPGDFVWVFYPTRIVGKTDRFLHKYHGPMKVVSVSPNGVNYTITGTLRGKHLELEKVHVSRLKPFYFREELINDIEKRDHPPVVYLSDSDSDSDEAISNEDSETEVYDYDREMGVPEADLGNSVAQPGRGPTSISGTDLGQDMPVLSNLKPSIDVLPEAVPGRDLGGDLPSQPSPKTPKPTPETDRVLRSQAKLERQMKDGPKPRRSLRVPKLRKPYNQLLYYMLILLLACSSGGEAALDLINPILWRKSTTPVVVGSNRVLVSINYKSPCIVFGSDYFKNYNVIDAKNVCQRQFETDFIRPMQNFCKQPIDYAQNKLRFAQREKRVAFLAIGIIAVITVAVSAIIGLASSAYVQANSAKAEIAELKGVNEIMMRRLAETQTNEVKLKELIEILQQEARVVEGEISQTKTILNDLIDTLPRAVSIISNIIARLVTFRERLQTVSRSWQAGKLDPTLLDLFNITLPCGKLCPVEMAHPVECLIDTERDVVSLTFDVKLLRPDTSLLEADSFTLYRRHSGSNICSIIYKGPKALIYDTKEQCVVTHPHTSLKSSNLVLIPDQGGCQTPSPKNLTNNYWEADECFPSVELRPTDIVQVKSNGLENVIYCETLNITVFNRTLQCPALPFPVPSNIQFAIGDLNYRAQTISQEAHTPFEAALSTRINVHLMPEMHSFEFDSLLDKFNETLEQVDNSNLEYRPAIYSHFVEYFAVIFIICVVVGCCYVLKFCPCKRKVRVNEEVELEEVAPNEGTPPTHRLVRATVHSLPNSRSQSPVRAPSRSASIGMPSHGIVVLSVICLSMQAYAYTERAITLQLDYRNPCEPLTQLNASAIEKLWCQERFDEAFISPLNKFCSRTPEVIESEIFYDKVRTQRSLLAYNIYSLTNVPYLQNNDNRNPRLNLLLTTLGIELDNIRSAVQTIGKSWEKGLLDNLLIESKFANLNISGVNLADFKPRTCHHDPICSVIRLELGLIEPDISDLSKITIAFLSPIISFGLWKATRKLMTRKNRGKRVRFDMEAAQTLIIPRREDEGVDFPPLAV